MPHGVTATLDQITEKQLTTQIVDLARSTGFRRYHTWRSTKSPAGWPDEALCRDRLVLLELKTEKGKTTREQREWLRALHAAHVETYVIRPRNVAALAVVLSARAGSARWAEARGSLLLELDAELARTGR